MSCAHLYYNDSIMGHRGVCMLGFSEMETNFAIHYKSHVFLEAKQWLKTLPISRSPICIGGGGTPTTKKGCTTLYLGGGTPIILKGYITLYLKWYITLYWGHTNHHEVIYHTVLGAHQSSWSDISQCIGGTPIIMKWYITIYWGHTNHHEVICHNVLGYTNHYAVIHHLVFGGTPIIMKWYITLYWRTPIIMKGYTTLSFGAQQSSWSNISLCIGSP